MGADPTELELEDARILEESEILLHLGIKYHLKGPMKIYINNIGGIHQNLLNS